MLNLKCSRDVVQSVSRSRALYCRRNNGLPRSKIKHKPIDVLRLLTHVWKDSRTHGLFSKSRLGAIRPLILFMHIGPDLLCFIVFCTLVIHQQASDPSSYCFSTPRSHHILFWNCCFGFNVFYSLVFIVKIVFSPLYYSHDTPYFCLSTK